jgi:hypothetical protein
MKFYVLLLDRGVMKLFQRVTQRFSDHIVTMTREREDI